MPRSSSAAPRARLRRASSRPSRRPSTYEAVRWRRAISLVARGRRRKAVELSSCGRPSPTENPTPNYHLVDPLPLLLPPTDCPKLTVKTITSPDCGLLLRVARDAADSRSFYEYEFYYWRRRCKRLHLGPGWCLSRRDGTRPAKFRRH